MCTKNGRHRRWLLRSTLVERQLPNSHFRPLPCATWTKVTTSVHIQRRKIVARSWRLRRIFAARKSVAEQFRSGSIERIRMQNICYNEYANVSQSSDHPFDMVTDWNEFRQFLLNISQPCSEMLLMCRFALEEFDCMKVFDAVLSDEGSS